MHVQKFTSNQMGNMLTHFNRNNGQDRNYGNENIDKSKSEQNYNLAPEREISEVEFIRDRLKEVKHMKRDDTIKLADWCVTLPKDYQGDERQFFETTYKALESRYGRENVVSAYVHRDEITPHMHFAFMPITRTLDKDNKPIEKLCAKDVLNRQDLITIHKDIERVLERNLDKEVNILNKATKDGNRAIIELKRDTAIKTVEKIKDFEKIEDKQLQVQQPIKVLGHEYISLDRHKKEIEKVNKDMYLKEREITQLREDKTYLVNHSIELEKSRNLEHERRLELEDKLKDKDYLKEQLREIEKEQEHTHNKDFERSR